MQFYSPNKRLKVLIQREGYENLGGLIAVTTTPIFAEFSGNMYETDDEAIIETLKRSHGYADEANPSALFWPYQDPMEEVRKREEYVRALEAENLANREKVKEAEQLLQALAPDKKDKEATTTKTK